MNNWILLLGLLFLTLYFSSCKTEEPFCDDCIKSGMMIDKIKGMSIYATTSPIQNTPVQSVKNLGVGWVAVLPYAFFLNGDPKIDSLSLCPVTGCPYGPNSKFAVYDLIQNAKSEGLKVMIKPQLWSPDVWVGDMTFPSEAKWDTLEMNYTNYIMEWVNVAIAHNVETFCIGTEMRSFVAHRPTYWLNLIASIRQVYSGELTYAANWDSYQAVNFWEELDYIGVDAYFSLIPDQTPSVSTLKTAWEPHVDALGNFSNLHNRSILFTEFGYLSVDGCAYRTWDLEQTMSTNVINEQAQANATQALLEVFAEQSWWLGGFQWKWYADNVSASCDPDLAKDYSPEGKMTEDLLRQMYN